MSSPKDVAHRNPAVAAPEPVLEVPGLLLRSQGLCAGPNAELIGSPRANSLILSFPKSMAPAALRLASTVASSLGIKSVLIWEASVVRMPSE